MNGILQQKNKENSKMKGITAEQQREQHNEGGNSGITKRKAE